MSLFRTLRTALRALRRNPMRAVLTTLGIVIGVGAVIAMMEIGQGSSKSIQKGISALGSNVIMIIPGSVATGGVSMGSGSVTTLRPEDCDAILRECPAVRTAAPIVRARAQVVYGNRNAVPSIYGSTAAYLDVRQWGRPQEGALFTERDVRAGNRVCLLGKTAAQELFEDKSPIGKEIRVKNVSFRVVGVLPAKGADMVGMDQDDILIAPWTAIKYRVTGSMLQNTNQSAITSSSSVNTLSNLYPGGTSGLYPEQSENQAANNPMAVRFSNVDMIMAAARTADDIPNAIKQITKVLKRRHRIAEGKDNDFDVRDMTEMTNMFSSTTRLMTNLLLCVALISLVVGGVGIMNIMLVSVTERTREIGLRMAVGARPQDILGQFLIEASVLCLLGGGIGIALGRGTSALVRLLLRWPTQLSLEAIAASVAVSLCVGVIFGFYPAWKASKLDPIEALRYE